MSDDKPTREQMANTHDPRGCHFCMDERHGDQAPDPLELENDRLRASIEGITATLDATLAAFGREREALRAEVERMKTVAFQAQNAAIDLAQQVATLTAERDALREEVAMGRKAMGVLAFEMERLKVERDRAVEHATEEESQKWAAIAERDAREADCAALRKCVGELKRDFATVAGREREACAQVADTTPFVCCSGCNTSFDIARAIRARGAK